jgi:hypothetical protein
MHAGQNLRTDLARRGIVPTLRGTGRVDQVADCVRLTIGPQQDAGYSNAQLDDYHCDGSFRQRAPVTLQIRARFTIAFDAFAGTAGFGFWNDPVGMTGRLRLAPPRALWFFLASPHCEMPLVLDRPGWGWMAATLGVSWPTIIGLAPIAPALAMLQRIPAFNRYLWPWLRSRLRLAGTVLDPAGLTDWHDYVLAWRASGAEFSIDGTEVAHYPVAPRGSLGLVVWIDNQYLVARETGALRGGTSACNTQGLEIADLRVTPG